MSRRSRSPYAVLGLVAQASKSGYDISKMFERARFLFWNESYGQIYPALKRLFEQGLVERHNEPREIGQAKKIYTLTEEGEEALRHWLRQRPGPVTIRDEVALRVTYGGHTSPQMVRGLLEQERDRVALLVESYQEEDPEQLNDFERMGLSWSGRYVKNRMEWVESCLEQLDEIEARQLSAREKRKKTKK